MTAVPPAEPAPVDEHGREPEHEHHHLHIDGKTAIGATIAAVAVYEVAVTTINRALDEPLLPTSSHLISLLDAGEIYRFLTPQWLRTAALLGAGAIIGTLGVAGGVVGMTRLDTPEERERAAAGLKRFARKTAQTAESVTAPVEPD